MGSEGQKNSLGNGKNYIKNKEEGALGNKDINMFNTTLLGKWKWRLGTKK